MPIISISGGSSFEGVGSNRGFTTFTITLDEASDQNVSVSFRTENSGFAIPGFDYFSRTGVVTFAPGETVQVVTVTHEGDQPDESDENYTLELFSPVNADLEGNAIVLSATGVITDDENGANDRALFVSDPKLLETDGGDQIARFEVLLSEASASSITLAYSTHDGTAIAGSDYTATSGSLTFAPGQTSQFVDVAILGDAAAEKTEAFSLVVEPTAAIFGGTQDSTGIATIFDDDGSALPIINVSGGSAREGVGSNRGSVDFVVTLSEASFNDVTVLLETRNDGSAEEGLDYFGGTASLTFSPGETQKIVTITHEGDSRTEGDENYTLILHSPTNAALAGSGPELTAHATILDDEQGYNVALFVSDPVITETGDAAQQVVFEVRLSRPATSDITLAYETRDGTALAGEDYTATSGTITFEAGQTLAQVAVDLIDNAQPEVTEQFSLVFSPNGLISNDTNDAAGQASILDDDSATSLPIVSLLGGENREGVGSNRGTTDFVVILSEASFEDITVQYRTVMNGSARETFDYFGRTDSITFSPGETRKQITITHEGDSTDDRDENYTLTLFAPDNAVLSGDGPTLSATGVVLDDEGGDNRSLFVSDPEVIETDGGFRIAQFKLELSEPAPNDITLAYTTVDGTAHAGEDYTATSGTVTFLAGQTLASVSVPVLGDTNIEGTEVFSLVVTPNGFIQNDTEDSAGLATIFDNDSASNLPIISIQGGGDREGVGSSRGSTDFIVTLSEASLLDVSVAFRTLTDGFAQEGFDFFGGEGVLTFAPGETQKFISVTHEGDSSNDADESYTLELHSPDNAVLSGDTPTIQAKATIFDDEGGANLALFVSDPKIVEQDGDGAQAVFELTLSRPATNDISLAFQTVDGSARAGEDYTTTSGVVTFLAGQTFASIAVDVAGDDTSERPETFSLVVTPNGFIENETQDSSGIATIFDDDATSDLPIVSIVGAENREGVGSNRGTADFYVSLSKPSTQTITVDVATVTDGSALVGVDFFENVQTLSFAPGETERSVTVTHNGDSANESDENYSLVLTNPTGAVLSGEESNLAATGIILDDENSENDLSLFVSDPEIFEGDTGQKNAVFEILLSAPSTSDISLSYTTVDGTATAGSDYQATSGIITFLAGQTVSAIHVPVFGDTTLEAAETFSLSITPNGFIQNTVEDATGVAVLRNDDAPPVVADLSITSLAVTETETDVGGTATVTFTLANTGDTPANDSQVAIFLSSDTTITQDDTPLATVTVNGSLAAGETSTQTTTVTLPGNVAQGSYFVGAIADPSNTLPETNETNNASPPDSLFVSAVPTDAPVFRNGNSGDDILSGLSNNDRLDGAGGDDFLQGNGGDDEIIGGSGFDTAGYSGDRDAYSITIGAQEINIQDRRPGQDGRDVLDGIERIAFGDQNWNIAQFSEVANLSEDAFRSFVEVYIAYFNRAPDAEGLFFWGTTFSNGLSLEQISEFFFVQPETQATYPDPSDTAFFVESVYGNVLGRAIDQAGFDFWTSVLNSGAVTEAQFLLEIIRGAKAPAAPGSDPDFVAQKEADVAYLTNKTDVGIYYSAILGMSNVNNARETYSDFDGSAQSTLAARDKVDQFFSQAQEPDDGEFLLNLVGVVETPDWDGLS
ncbi:MAG: DUF4214 domain-containing protein [Rhodobacteraceae bacterium]|nr:DUF4214 domain-containing protein [Paracoccaceae bacterium]